MSIKKIIYIALGYLFVGLGIIGIFLPIMPTTIFLIIAAAFFARNSEHLYNKLISHKKFGKMIKDYRENRGMPLKAKIISISMLTAAIMYSIFFAVNHVWLKILLAAICIGVSIYIISLNTIESGAEE